CSRNLDVEVSAAGGAVQLRGLLNRRVGVVRQQRRDLERDPAVDAVGAAVNVAEQIGGVAQVLEREREEQLLAGGALLEQALDRVLVGVGAADRLVEDRRVRGQPGDRELVDV